jgi:hypothetical protein
MPPSATLLPTEKTKASGGWAGKTILLHGPPKIGKSTLAAQLDARALFIATEPGQSALEIFRVPIQSWEQFLNLGQELQGNPGHGFPLFVVDTVDELARLCTEHVVSGLAKADGLDPKKFHHASEFDYGRGWDAIAQEFRLRVSRLCNLGAGVLFVSHTKENVQKTRTGLEITKLGPDVGQKGMRKWLLGFVDYIFMADVIQTTEGEQRILRLQPSETVEAGARIPHGAKPLPETIPLTAADLKAALAASAAAAPVGATA